jgi:hypothetical protein
LDPGCLSPFFQSDVLFLAVIVVVILLFAFILVVHPRLKMEARPQTAVTRAVLVISLAVAQASV